MTNPQKILVVGVNWLGDALMMTPSLRALRKAYPSARIECLVPERVRLVFERNPHVDAVRVYRDRASMASLSFWKTVSNLKHARFDTAILFHGSATKARLVKWAGIPHRWGYGEGAAARALLTRSVKLPVAGSHRAQIYLDLLAGLGIPDQGRYLEYIPSALGESDLTQVLREAGIAENQSFFVIHAGGNWQLKRWPEAHFRTLIKKALAEYSNAVAVLCGSENERGLAKKIAEGLDPARVYVLAGQTQLDALALLFKKALFVLSNDSGPIHLAASQNARIVGLFGPTSPAQTGPWGAQNCEILWRDPGCEIPCYFKDCQPRVCMEGLLPEKVLEACLRVGRRP